MYCILTMDGNRFEQSKPINRFILTVTREGAIKQDSGYQVRD